MPAYLISSPSWFGAAIEGPNINKFGRILVTGVIGGDVKIDTCGDGGGGGESGGESGGDLVKTLRDIGVGCKWHNY